MPEEEWKEVGGGVEEDEEEAWVSDEPEVTEVPEEEPVEFFQSFDARWRNAFEGLAYLGHLEGEVKIPYHSFSVRTLTAGEKIKVVELVQHLENSIGYARAYRAAVVAAGLMLVDGKPLLVGSRKIDAISQRYQYVIENWYDYVIDVLYDRINELEGQVLEVLKELGVYQNRREVAQVEAAEVNSGTEPVAGA